MPEIRIDPKFNIHETYKRVNIINPYRYGGTPPPTGSFEPETLAYKSRVESDGGSVMDINFVDAAFKEMKMQSILGNLLHWSSSRGGIKQANNLIEKVYSLDSSNNDAVQPTEGYKPLLENGTAKFDGNDDHLNINPITLSSTSSTIYFKLTAYNFVQMLLSSSINGAYMYFISDSRIRIQGDSGGVVSVYYDVPFQLNVENDLFLVRDNGVLKSYFNGVSLPNYIAYPYTFDDIGGFKFPGAYEWDGAISELTAWSTALTFQQTEVIRQL